MQTITTFLMFDGKAEQTMNLYVSLFADSEIKSISRYEENEEGPVGAVRHAVFSLNGQSFMCIDSAVKHGFTFTPATSLALPKAKLIGFTRHCPRADRFTCRWTHTHSAKSTRGSATNTACLDS